MKKKVISLMLALVLLLGLAAPALAYNTPDFVDVPKGNWAYDSVMRMADRGIVKGTGNKMFSPNGIATAEQFITLVGRIVFPDVKATGSDWSGPYVTEAKTKGMLAGTTVTNETLKNAITRYDMAVILRVAARELGAKETLAEPSAIADYGLTPTMYADAIRAAYGSGLIKGDDKHNFNGQNPMRRNELAIVMDRLLNLREEVKTSQQKPELNYHLSVFLPSDGVMVLGERNLVSCSFEPYANAPKELQDRRDREGFTCTSSDPATVQIVDYDGWNWHLKALKPGTATITITDPYGISGAKDVTVVEGRTGLKTETYRVRIGAAHYSEYSFKGAAYTQNTYLYGIPYKIYYTRDGGETSQLVYEGVTPKEFGSPSEIVAIELPEDAFYSKDAGFYISAETTTEDGRRMVTSDLRTDGRAYATLVSNTFGFKQENGAMMEFLLTPPNGAKAKLTFYGIVGHNGASSGIEGLTVRLYHKSGMLLGETVSGAGGEFTMNFEVDALDGGFDVQTPQYYPTAIGIVDGIQYENTGKYSSGELNLRSLNGLGANPDDPRGFPVIV